MLGRGQPYSRPARAQGTMVSALQELGAAPPLASGMARGAPSRFQLISDVTPGLWCCSPDTKLGIMA